MCQMKSKDCSGNVTVFLLKEADGAGVPWPLPSGSSAWTWNTASNSSIYFAMMEYIQKNPSDTSPATIKWLQQHQLVCASRLTVTWEKIHFLLKLLFTSAFRTFPIESFNWNCIQYIDLYSKCMKTIFS